MDVQERKEIRNRQSFALSAATDHCDPEFLPDFSAKNFAPAHWYSRLPAPNTLLALNTVPPQLHPVIPHPTSKYATRYLRLNPYLKGKHVNFAETDSKTTHLVSKKGTLARFGKFGKEQLWLEAIVSDFQAKEDEPEQIKVKSIFRISFAGDWTSAQDRWWKFGPGQLTRSYPKQPLFAPLDFTFFQNKSLSLIGGITPVDQSQKYQRPADLGPIT